MAARAAGLRGADLPLVVALHARGGDATGALSWARAQFGDDADIVALQAARPCNPFQSNLRANAAYSGFSWYLGDDPSRPEAASFGDALAQLDAFVRTIDRPFVLAGEGQGAVLARALAAFSPDGLAGVHAPGGSLPVIAGWEAPTCVGVEASSQAGVDAAAWLAALSKVGGRRA